MARSEYDIVIVGAGPAGCSAALQIARRRPDAARRTLLLDRAVFPRVKLCGGAIVRRSEELLARLGVSVEVPSVRIHAVRFQCADGAFVRRGRDMFRIVRREDFDLALLRAAEAAGVRVHQGEEVTWLERDARGVDVVTSRDTYRARVVIGADGAGSLVRRALLPKTHGRFLLALEALTPEDTSTTPEFRDGTAVFDFTQAAEGVAGYYWDFPSVRGGRALMNRGICAAGGARKPRLRPQLEARFRARGIALEQHRVEGGYARLYGPRVPQAATRVVLAGDAVGVNPLSGEGISSAIGVGMLAADTALESLGSGQLGFETYEERLRRSAIGQALRAGRASARSFYRAASSAPGLQDWLVSMR